MSKRRIIIRIPSGGAPPTPASTTGVGGSGGSSASPKRARIGDSGVGTTPALIQASIAVAGMEYRGGKGMGGCGVGGGGSPLPLATSIAEETGEGRAGGYSGGKRSTATSGSTSTAEVDPEVVGGEITLRFTNNTNTNCTCGSDTEDEAQQEADTKKQILAAGMEVTKQYDSLTVVPENWWQQGQCNTIPRMGIATNLMGTAMRRLKTAGIEKRCTMRPQTNRVTI